MENLSLEFFKNKKIHFIGIGGISMSALALMLKANGIEVQGSNEVENTEVIKLQKQGVQVFIGHNKKNIKGVDIVVYSSAILEDNIEILTAKKYNLPLIKRAELLGLIANEYKLTISVAGSHGKTTASAMISEMLVKCGYNPTFHIGGVLNSLKSNYNIGTKNLFVTESCEYKDNFLYLKPDVSVILNIDADHLDYFGDLNGVIASFKKFAKNIKKGGINIVCLDDENSKDVIDKSNTLTFGLSKRADIYAVNIKEYKPCYFSFDVVFSKYKLGNVKLNIIGKHNVFNALVCVAVGLALKIDFCDAKNAIESFSGVERRCQLISEENGVAIYHDYAHHPEQIEKMLLVAKGLVKKSGGKVIGIFEPHTYSRTKFLINEFALSFKNADHVIFAPVYPARELPEQGYDSYKLANETKKYNTNVECIDNFKDIKLRIENLAKPNDVVFILGAGTIEKLAKMFII